MQYQKPLTLLSPAASDALLLNTQPKEKVKLHIF